MGGNKPGPLFRSRAAEGETALLRATASTRRVDSLFKAMSTDFLLREQFVTDPAQIMSEYVHGTSLPPERATEINRLLYSIIATPGVLDRLRDFRGARDGEPPTRAEFLQEFGRAVTANDASHVVFALMRNEPGDIFQAEDSLLAMILEVLVRGGGSVASTEMSTGTYATEQSGTHMSTGGAVFATEMSTGTYATEQSGTHMSTGGAVFATEMSTGTYATEQSGTHMSGGLVGMRIQPEAVTLDALVSYANELKRVGALDVM